MITGLDHVTLLTPDLARAERDYEILLGCAASWRAQAEGIASVHFTLGNTTLELIAPAGPGAGAERAEAALAMRGEGLASLCFAVSDIDRMHRRLSRLALEPEDVRKGGSLDHATGAELAWQITRTATSASHGVRLFFLSSTQVRRPAREVDESPVTGLDHVVVASQNPDRAAALYGARLGLDMALDRSRLDWGRLMFFRCGDLIVEVVQRPGQVDPAAPDRLWGLSWRVDDIEQARRRLSAAGVDVSPIRDGRKPGTRVMSIKSGTSSVPTLMLQRGKRA